MLLKLCFQELLAVGVFSILDKVFRNICNLGYKVRYEEDVHFNIKLKKYKIWLSFLNDIVIQTYVEMDDELPDAILNYFEPVFIGVRPRNERKKELKRERSCPLHSRR